MSDERHDQSEGQQAENFEQREGQVENQPLTDLGHEIPVGGDPIGKPSFDQIVEEWFDSHIRGSIAGQNTQVWNHLFAAKERLKDRLRSL